MAKPQRKLAPQSVHIPCQIQPGAFPGEFLITIKFGDEVVSGFVRENFLKFDDESQKSGSGFVRGTIVEQSEEETVIQMPGSFFTTATGLTSVSSKWAESNLVPA